VAVIVRAEGVRKAYRNGSTVEALAGVDVQIRPGELVAVNGPSGSGKTTLLNCLSGLEHVDEGRVTVEGADLHRLSDDERTDWRARRMGFVFQAFNLLPVLSAVENVEVPLLLTGARRRDVRRRAMEMLGAVGLSHRADHRPNQLSGGEQQRVTVARALVHEPAVVWADEPTGNLDSETGQQIVGLFTEMTARGHTVVLVTHDAALAERADRTIRMRDGRIEVVDEGTAPVGSAIAGQT
jgi:putative ABC transport system ATP-binding protein